MTAVRWEAHGDAIGYAEEGDWTPVAYTDGSTGAAESMAARQQLTDGLTDAEVADMLHWRINVGAVRELVAALRECVGLITTHTKDDASAAVDRARAAIAKAGGR